MTDLSRLQPCSRSAGCDDLALRGRAGITRSRPRRRARLGARDPEPRQLPPLRADRLQSLASLRRELARLRQALRADALHGFGQLRAPLRRGGAGPAAGGWLGGARMTLARTIGTSRLGLGTWARRVGLPLRRGRRPAAPAAVALAGAPIRRGNRGGRDGGRRRIARRSRGTARGAGARGRPPNPPTGAGRRSPFASPAATAQRGDCEAGGQAWRRALERLRSHGGASPCAASPRGGPCAPSWPASCPSRGPCAWPRSACAPGVRRPCACALRA
jgi:hypothetical protein